MIPDLWAAFLLAVASTTVDPQQDLRADVQKLRSAIEKGSASADEKQQYIDGVSKLSRANDPSADEESVLFALDLAQELEDADRQASLHIALGYRLNDRGKYEDALLELHVAAELAESPATRIWALAALVDPCMQTHRFDEGRAAVEQARLLLSGMEAPAREPMLQVCLAEYRCRLALGLLDLCQQPLDDLARLAPLEAVDGDPAWAATAILCRLDWLVLARRYEEALEYGAKLDRGLLHLYRDCEAQADLRLGVAAWHSGDDARAQELFDAVRRNPAAAQAELAQAESRLAEIAANQERREDALALLRSARARLGPLERMGATSLDDQLYLTTLECRLGSVEPAALDPCFERFVAERRAAQPRPGGMSILGTLRSRMFLAERMRTQMAKTPGEGGRIVALQDLCRLHALGGLPRALSAETSASAPSFAAIRAHLTDDDSGLLVYFPGRLEGFVFAIDSREIRCATIPGEAQLVEESRALALLMSLETEKSAARLASATKKLGEALLPAPIHPQLERWNDVGVVGLEHLGSIYPELLPFEGRRLEQRMAVSYPLSLPTVEFLWQRAERRPQERDLDLVLFAAPSLADAEASGKPGKLRPIPFDDEHRKRLLDPLGERRVSVFARDAATREALASDEVRHARVLALVTHGELDEAREQPAAFRLASRGDQKTRMGCTEVEELRVPPVVILVACKASKGPARPGDAGVSDLGGAFLRAGAEVVLLAPSTIEYEDACKLLGRILEHLHSGDPPTRALNRARLQFLEENGADPSRGLLRVVGLGNRRIW